MSIVGGKTIEERVKIKHMSLARLPIMEKLKLLVRMQERSNEIRRAKGRPERPVWKLS